MAPRRPVSELDSHLGYWLRFVSNHVSHAFAQKVEAKGVTVAEWVALRELHDTGAVNPSVLAERMGMTRGAISKLVERLCNKELVVRRVTGDDKRYQLVEITREGKQLVPILARLADENEREFFDVLSDQQRSDLMATMKSLVAHHGWKNIPLE
jgi:DNA-binding MarR family transcriptional regulator